MNGNDLDNSTNKTARSQVRVMPVGTRIPKKLLRRPNTTTAKPERLFITQWVCENAIATLTICGVMLYGASWFAYDYAYRPLGLTPEEVGMSYARVVRTAGIFLCIVFVASVGHFLLAKKFDRPNRVWYMQIVLIFMTMLIVGAYVNELDRFDRNLEAGTPLARTLVSPLSLRLDPAKLRWLTPEWESRLPQGADVLYLGESEGITAIYYPVTRKAYRLASSTVTFELSRLSDEELFVFLPFSWTRVVVGFALGILIWRLKPATRARRVGTSG